MIISELELNTECRKYRQCMQLIIYCVKMYHLDFQKVKPCHNTQTF